MNTKRIIMENSIVHFNEIFIDSSLSLKRLIGFCETDEDYYYVVSDKNDINKISYISAVCKPIFFKGLISNEDYKEIDRILSINGSTEAKEIIIQGI